MNYPKLPALTPDGALYENELMDCVQALIPPGPYKTAHAPCLLALPDGAMLCCWFAGSFEGAADVSIVCARLEKDGLKWSEPVMVSGDPERSEQNPSLFLAPSGEVWCMYTAQLARAKGKDNMQFTSQVRLQRSRDGGRTWSAYETMFPKEGTFARQPIQVLSNGRWIFSNWLCSDSASGLAGDPTVFQISDDEGKTWREVPMPESSGRVHANVVELGGGRLAAFMRSREADFVYRSESEDYGDTWSAPVPTELPNNNSGLSAIRLADGRIAIACNPTCAPQHEKGAAAWPGLRCPVCIAISEDEGKTFPIRRNLEQGEGYCGALNRTNNRQYEYPYLMQTNDGMLHLAYAARDRLCIEYQRVSVLSAQGAKLEAQGLYNPTSAKVR
ncbi:MAG: sialidase family protein [Succinivibrio sp.]|jgi:predicted neuraminidase|nr:sialidase family protein [Succinivibrio sp.]